MLKNRLFLTVTSIMLGVSLVGIANADTINSAMTSVNDNPAQHQINNNNTDNAMKVTIDEINKVHSNNIDNNLAEDLEVEEQNPIAESNSGQHKPGQVHNGLDNQQTYDNMQQVHHNTQTQQGNTIQHHQPLHNTNQHNNMGNHNNGRGMHH